jgi:hypothetical protein
MNEELKKLYDAIASRGFYTKSYDEFVNQYQDPAYRDKVFAVVTREGLYTKGRNEFDAKYSAAPLKKKEPSVSTSQEGAMAPATEAGSLASQESAPVLDFTKLRQQQQVQQYGELPTQPKTESMLSPEAKAQVDERIKRGEVQVAPVVKAEEPVGVSEKLAYLWDSGVNVLSDLSQNVRQSVMGLDRASVYEFVDKNRDQFPELYNEYTKLKGQGASDADAAYGAYLQMVAMDPTLETRVNSFVRSKDKEKLREEIGSDLSKEQREKLSSDLVTSALGGLVESTPAMLSSGSTYGLSFFDMAYKGAEDMLAQEFEQNPELKLTAAQQEEYKLASGAVMAVLEKVGLSNTIKANPLIRRALTARVLSSMAGLGKKAGSEAFEKVVKKELGTLARVSKGIGSGFVAEAETGALQELAQNGLNYYVNETSGKTVFDGKSATELIKDVLRAGIAEGIGGGFIGGVVNVFANPDAITEEEFAKARTFASEVDIKKVQQHLAEEMSAGKMSKEEASRILNNINEFRAVANSVPDDVSSEAQAKIFKLIKEKQDISKSVAGKDEAIQAVAKEQIKAIDENIKELYVTSKTQPQDAVQEQATDESVLRAEQPEVGLQEVVEGDQEPQVATEEVVQEEVTSQGLEQQKADIERRRQEESRKNKARTIDRQPLSRINPEGDSIPIERNSNELKRIGRLIDKKINKNSSPAQIIEDLNANSNISAGNNTLDLIKRFIAERQSGKTTQTFEQWYNETVSDVDAELAALERTGSEAPATGGDVQEIESRRQKEIEERGLNRLFPLSLDDDAEGRRIQEEREQLDADLQELNARYDAEIAALGETTPVAQPTVEDAVVQEEVAAEVDAQELADLAADMQAATPARRERLERVAKRARAAVSRILPDVKIIVHDTQEAYRAATTFEGEATYNNDTKTIHINGTKATPAAVAHEVFHAVFLDKVKTDAKAQAVAKKMVESLKRVLGENSEAYQYLDEFSKDYDANFQNEEKLAEMVAVLSELYSGVNDIGLSPSAVQSVKNAIKKFITDLAKLFNISMATTLTDADVLAVLNTIAQKAVTGEVITEADVRTIDRVAAEDITPVEQSEVQMRERKGLITITEREAQKYARIGINDARVAQAMEDLGLAGVKFTKGDVETAISKAFDKAIDELKADMYSGQPALITQDSPGITNAIQAEITALEEQGASLSRIESAKQMINDPGTRNNYIKKYQDAQAETLIQWVSYLEQSDYDPAFKFLMLDAVVTNNYDLKTQKYVKRDNKTIRNITPFDAGTLAELYGMTDSKELLKTYAEIQADNASRVVKANMMKSTKEGKWLKFAGGNNVSEAEREVNATALSQLVQDTYWCTKTNAKSQLDGGDFYVYVTEGTDMRPIPRIAVRMDGSDVGELRGNASSKQDLEPEMLPVAEKFLKEEIPGGSGQTWLNSIAFNKKAKAFAESIEGSTLSMDMINEFAKLSSESGRYNVDYGRNGFIERIEESIKAKVKAGDVTPELDGVIETSLGDANPRTKIFVGNVRRPIYHNFLTNVEVVIGDVTIDGTDIAPRNLRVITGDLDLGNNIQSLSNIETVGGEIFFGNSINTLEDLGKIEVINAVYSFSPPTRIKKFDYLKTINGDLDLRRASFPESLGSLEVINGSLNATGSDLNSLGNLKSVSSYAILPRGVKKIDGVSFGDSLELFDGTEIINVKTIPGSFSVLEVPGMKSKHSATGSIEEIGGLANLGSSSSTMLGNLKRVGKSVVLPGNITSLGNLTRVGGNVGLYNYNIKSLDNLEYVGGNLDIYSRALSSLGSLKYVGGDAQFTIFSELKALDKLEYVGGRIGGAKNIKDIGALSSVGERWISGLFKNNTGEDVDITAFAARYVADSRIGGPIAEKVYDLALKQASKYFGVELPPAPRQRKDSDAAYENWKNGPKSVAQEIGYKYNMNHKGYTPSNIVKQHFKNEVERLSSRLSIRSTITGSGYYMTLDGKFFNPYLKVIGGQDSGPNGLRQRMGQPNENIFDIVTMARQKGYTDKTIEIYLKQEGFAAQDIKDAMAVNSNIDGAQVPQEFGNVTGGMAQGQTLFDEIKAKLTKMAADGASMMDIRIEAQTLLMDSEVYKAQSVEVKAQLRLSLDATIGTKAADRAFRQEFKQLRAMLADRKKARRELETIKRMMRGFIRKNLPQGEYSKAEVVALLKSIVDANVDTLPLVMEKVEGYVTGFKVRKLEKQIQKLLDTKTTGMVSGRQVGRVSVELQNQLAELNDKESPVLADDSMSEEAVESLMSNQIATYNRIMAQTYITEQEAAEAQLLSIAMMYNDAYMMEDTNPNKVETLQSVVENLAAMIATGRAEMRAELDQQRAQYKAMVAEAYSEITGEQLDMSDTEDAKAANKKKIREAKNIEEKKKNFRNRIKGAIGKMSSFVDNYFTRQMDLPLLLSRITSVITESFGGKLQETVDGRLFDARTEFTRRKMEVMKMLEQKQKEIFGKDYKNQMAMNVVPRFSKDIVTDADAVFTDMTEADELRKEYKSANDKRRKAIVARLTDLEIELSPNQDYYLYNQYKDPANRASFIEKFGEDNYAKAMEIITNRLDPKVKEWADWQVNELFPSLYEAYNEVYRAVYRTNMPWNQFYAGRIYREGKEGDNTFDLLQGSTEYRTSVGGQSTKARIRNQRPIENMDGNSALNSYLEDMEYFRAYAEVMRDMNKLFENPNIEDAINKTAGSNTHRALKDMMGRIAARGVKGSESQVVNGMINNYIVSKLGFNPTIMVKQLTSAIAFSDYIGWGNWSLYMAKAMPDAKSLWKEWYDNSPVLQERYENSNMGEVLEGYNRTAVAKTSPVLLNKKLFGKDVTILDSDVAKWQNSLMYLIKVGDKGGVMGGLANYLYYKDEFKAKNPNATEQQAIDYASRKATRQAVSTQQDSGITNKDWYQTSGPVARFLNVFMSSPKALFRKEMYAVMQLYRKISAKSTKAGAGSLTDNLRTLITYHVGVPMLFQWVALGLPGVLANWDEEDEESLGRAAILGNLNALFIVGDLLLGIKDYLEDNPWAGEFKTLPIFEQASEILQDLKAYSKAKKDETKEKHLVKLINHTIELTGIPASSMYRMYNNLSELADSDDGEAILRLLNFSEYVVEEKASEKK